MKHTIRPVEKKDNLQLAGIIREVFEEHDAPREGTVYSDPTTDNLCELFLKPKSILWVALSNNDPIGCCGIYPSEGLPVNCAELVKFYLSADARGKGIGKELMQKCIRSAIELGYKQLYLESLPHFAKAIGIYKREGFVKLNKPLGVSEHKTCSIWMLKELVQE
jgi:putative acetyltransferase